MLLAQAAAWIGWSTLVWLHPAFSGASALWIPLAAAAAVTLAAARFSARRLATPGQRH
jgi:hypothetical protein